MHANKSLCTPQAMFSVLKNNNQEWYRTVTAVFICLLFPRQNGHLNNTIAKILLSVLAFFPARMKEEIIPITEPKGAYLQSLSWWVEEILLSSMQKENKNTSIHWFPSLPTPDLPKVHFLSHCFCWGRCQYRCVWLWDFLLLTGNQSVCLYNSHSWTHADTLSYGPLHIPPVLTVLAVASCSASLLLILFNLYINIKNRHRLFDPCSEKKAFL